MTQAQVPQYTYMGSAFVCQKTLRGGGAFNLLLNKCGLHVDSVHFKHTKASLSSENLKPTQKVCVMKHIWTKIKLYENINTLYENINTLGALIFFSFI